MRSALSVLKRWQAMDAELLPGRWGLHVERFARRWQVSTKTVRRDLAAFRELGQRMHLVYTGQETEGEVREYVWRYGKGVKPLFVRNLRNPA
jgi:hypothetical protein